MTSDKVILDMVKGCHITFTHNQFPLQLRPPQSIKFTDWESSLMDQEIYTLLQMQTGALVGVVQVLEAHPFEDEVQPTVLFEDHPTNTAQQPTASQNTTGKHLRTNSGASGKYSFM